ncbi:NAD(P)H-binding protein [Zunongwangia sp.]|uniref:NAD(P)H-binding protein n=1 Tax=Zunongwangia sp. TaxID=1965325 RepID=UPI003AA7FBA4
MQISILGCGWLGFPLGKQLVDENYSLKGSSTSAHKIHDLANAKITPYKLQLFEDGIMGDMDAFLSGSSVLIIDVPPGLRKNPELNFTKKIEKCIPYIENSGIKNIIFISSTSVFQDTEAIQTYTEEDTPNGTSEAGRQLYNCEKLLQENSNFSTTIIRFGGLISNDRHPVTMLSGKINLKNGDAPVNLIRREDCINLISKIIENDEFGTVFNAAYPEHPSKAEYYAKEAKSRNIKAPEYSQNQISRGKIISSVNLEKIGFDFEHGI